MNVNLPDSIDNAITNLTDEPTKAIGKTLADIWDLVFGNFSLWAEKQRIKRENKIVKYYNEISAKIDAIPPEKKLEPSLQIVGQALDDSRYCLESEELRKMFVNLIANSMNSDYKNFVHPSFSALIKQMSPIDARMLSYLKSEEVIPVADFSVHYDEDGTIEFVKENFTLCGSEYIEPEARMLSISSLCRFGLTEIPILYGGFGEDVRQEIEQTDYFQNIKAVYPRINIIAKSCRLTPLGVSFVSVCIP